MEITILPRTTVMIAYSNAWSSYQIKAAAKAAKAGRSIGWQVAVARRAGYGKVS